MFTDVYFLFYFLQALLMSPADFNIHRRLCTWTW